MTTNTIRCQRSTKHREKNLKSIFLLIKLIIDYYFSNCAPIQSSVLKNCSTVPKKILRNKKT